MSISPSLSLVRLQELKLWQGSYDNLLQKSSSNTQTTRESASLDGSSISSLSCMEKDAREWDKRKISPAKPFEQLLEEKLAEDTHMLVNSKPKKPFLRKGEGLARFRMGTARPASIRNRHIECKRQGVPKTIPTSQPKTSSAVRKGILKKSNLEHHQDIDLSPLTIPDFVKSRGTWKQVFESSEKSLGKMAGDIREEQETLENYDEFRKSLGADEREPIPVERKRGNEQLFKASSAKDVLDLGTSKSGSDLANVKNILNSDFNGFNEETLQTVTHYAKKCFGEQNVFFSNDIPDNLSKLAVSKMPQQIGDLTMEELRMEKELKIFEVLEKKVDNSSFCSTNTSVRNILASTPQKDDLAKKRTFSEHDQAGDSIDVSANSVFPKKMQQNIQKQLQEVSDKTDLLQQFLVNLRNMERGNKRGNYSLESADGTGKITEKTVSTNTSFSDENTRWSTRSPSLDGNYTELDTTCQGDSWKKIDIGVNTSFDQSKLDETMKTYKPCKECENLRSKYTESKGKITELKSEISNLKSELKDFQKEHEKLKKTMKGEKETYQDKLDELQNELDSERKKFTKEKAYFERYVKEAQNRPSKKEREEITQLKQELADVKELLKLKETKTGATQARLRTQIKQQEKDLSELRITLEKLQKENAKLTASQKYARRPQEVKMLHEINRNLSKLAEETLKKQVNKSGIDTGNKETNNVGRKSENIDGDSCNKENKKFGTNTGNKEVQKSSARAINKDSFRSDFTSFDDNHSGGLSIEQQYETIFGHFDSPRNANASTNMDKAERTLADGSVEIKYSNGNLKTISADGNITKMMYFNGDTKETNLKERVIKYHYAATDSWHIQHPDGTEVMTFKDGQKCTKFTDGITEVSYPDGSLRVINPDGTEEQTFPDGRKTLKNLQGEQIIMLPNGQREIHTQDYKRREYPDGTIRTLHKDGTVETVYANGRVRLKDANGVLVMDTHQP